MFRTWRPLRDIGTGLDLGYRRGPRGAKWYVSVYVGSGPGRVSPYIVKVLGIAADKDADADGHAILNRDQAQVLARAKQIEIKRLADGVAPVARGPFTVEQAVDQHLQWMDEHKKSANDARSRAEALILPKLGRIECAKLSTAILQKWLSEIAAAPARRRTKPGAKQNYAPLDKRDTEATRRRRATANRTYTILKADRQQGHARRRL